MPREIIAHMDLRKYKLSPADLAQAKASLLYQPFRISEEIQSGIAYDWIHNKGVFQVDRREVDAETWKTFDAQLQSADHL